MAGGGDILGFDVFRRAEANGTTTSTISVLPVDRITSGRVGIWNRNRRLDLEFAAVRLGSHCDKEFLAGNSPVAQRLLGSLGP
jgi:hypothetical protein